VHTDLPVSGTGQCPCGVALMLARDEHREGGTVTALDCFGMKAVMWISARSEPTIVGSPIDPPVDPP